MMRNFALAFCLSLAAVAQQPAAAPAAQPAAPQPAAAQPAPVAADKPIAAPAPADQTLSADGKLAAVGSSGHVHGVVRVFDLVTGRVRATVGSAAPAELASLARLFSGLPFALVQPPKTRRVTWNQLPRS